ncbi:MAG: family 16 glycoside hydrolase, partial [Bacteroidota bacterium]
MRLLVSLLSLFTASSVLAQSDLRPSDWLQHDLTRPQPERVTPLPVDGPAPVPADATVLIPADGSSLDAWVSLDGSPAGWMVVDGGVEVVPGTGDIRTKDTFGDVQLHVEWKAPA